MIPTKTHRIRITILASLLLLGLVALGFRLYTLQVVRHAALASTVNKMHGRVEKLPALRGPILDCNENVMARSVVVRTVVLDPQTVREDDARRAKAGQPLRAADMARILGDELAMPVEEIRQKLDLTTRYVILKHKVPEETARELLETLKREHLRGVKCDDDQMRVYPNGALMSHVLGYMNSDQSGMDGVEKLMHVDLKGQDGWRRIECDRLGKEIVVFRNEDFPARNGCSVVLTLDQAIQSIAEQELDVAVQKYMPEDAVVIVMRPATGEVLAMASRPTFDPNAGEKAIDSLRNRAVSDLNEPGSTFKIVTIATALDNRIVTLNDTIWCENGKFLYGGRYLTDHEPFGSLTVAQVLEKSSNVGAAKVALMMGNAKMHRAMLNFGFDERAFGDQPGERWPGDVRGIVHLLKSWVPVSITRVAMGHEVAVTPIAMANAMCALANGGNLMRPMMIKRVVDQNGSVIREFFPKVRRRVVDQQAAHEITEALEMVVSKDGTAAKAAISGLRVAGKTGTAQKLVNGQYGHDEYVSSFIGYFPADAPELCIYVMFDNPKGKDRYGGAVAAPVFHNIGVRVASYMNLKLSRPEPSRVSASIIPASNHPGVMR